MQKIQELSQEELKSLQIEEFQEHEQYSPMLAKMMYGYQQPMQSLVADKIAPFVPLNGDTSGKYRKWNEDSFYNLQDDQLDDRTKPKEISAGSTLETYTLFGRGNSIYITDLKKDIAVSQFGSQSKYVQSMLEVLAWHMKLKKEKRVLDVFNTSGNYAAGYTHTVSTKWDTATAVPFSDYVTAQQKLQEYGITANASLIDSLTEWTLLQNSHVRDTILGGATKGRGKQAVLDRSDLARYFKIPEQNFFVSEGVYNTAPGGTQSMGKLMADNMIVFYLNPTVTQNTLMPAFIVQLILGTQSSIASGGWKLKKVRDEEAGGSGADKYLAWYWAEEKIHGQKLGYLIENTIT